MINSQNTTPKFPFENGNGNGGRSETSNAKKKSTLSNFQDLFAKFRNGIEINIDRNADHLTIDLTPRQRPLVNYKALKSHVGRYPSLMAMAGWDPSAEEPATLNFESSDWQHLLITGESKTGKSGLLKTILSDLALNTKPAYLQYAFIDGYRGEPEQIRRNGEQLAPFEYLPHTLAYTSHSADEAAELISFIREELDYRAQYEIKTPAIMLVIDDYQDHFNRTTYETIVELTYIARVGPKHGIRLILAGDPPTDPYIQDILETASFARIVGHIKDRETAEIATSLLDSQAENLGHKGEFLLIQENTISHFLAAALQKSDFQEIIGSIYQHRPPILLAHSFSEEIPFDQAMQAEPSVEPNFEPDDESDQDSEPAYHFRPNLNNTLTEPIFPVVVQRERVQEPSAPYSLAPQKHEAEEGNDPIEYDDIDSVEDVEERGERYVDAPLPIFGTKKRSNQALFDDFDDEETESISPSPAPETRPPTQAKKESSLHIVGLNKVDTEIDAETNLEEHDSLNDPWAAGLVEEEMMDAAQADRDLSVSHHKNGDVSDKSGKALAQPDTVYYESFDSDYSPEDDWAAENQIAEAQIEEEEEDKQEQDDIEEGSDKDGNVVQKKPRLRPSTLRQKLGESTNQSKKFKPKSTVKKRPPILKLNNGEK